MEISNEQSKKSIFAIVTILFWFSMYAYMPQLGSYAKELGASYKLIGLITGAYGLSQTVLRIPLGIVSDALKKRKIFIIMGVGCTILSASIVYLFPNPYALLIARFIAGVASATWVNFTVLFVSYFSPSEATKSVGIATSYSKVGQLLAMLTGGFVAVRFGINAIFLISSLVGLLCFILGFFLYEEKSTEKSLSTSSPGIFSVLKNKRVVHISLLGALTQAVTYSTNFGFTSLVGVNLGASSLELGFLSTLFNLPQILFSILASTFFVKKLGEKNTLLIGFGVTTFICLVTPFAPNLFTLYGLQIIAGMGYAITFPLLMGLVIQGVDSNLMTTTMGFFQAAYGVGMIVGPIVLGSVGDYFGLTAGFIVVGSIGIISMASTMKIKNV